MSTKLESASKQAAPKWAAHRKATSSAARMGNEYIAEISADHYPIFEMIDERFLGVTRFLTPHSLVFGSTVYDCILGEKFANDLDIIVPPSEVFHLLRNFDSSPRWVYEEDAVSVYEREKHRRLAVYNFRSAFNHRAQIITFQEDAPQIRPDSFDGVAVIARNVDFFFCGLVFDTRGRLFELLEGGYQDCLEKVIRLTKNSFSQDELLLYRRIQKYLSRGFRLHESNVQDFADLRAKFGEK